ncbi:MAG: hypothetical protein LBR97_01485, partial [Dysgonamonadaceae bacterium]|nr:hypothetical protein [Dysgonamonadaceae bacterium]
MGNRIKNISGVVPHTHKTVNMDLDGRNLIVTGANGSGKTSFLKAVYEKVDLLIAKKQGADLQQIKYNLKSRQDHLSRNQKGTAAYETMMQQVRYFENQINAIEEGLQVEIPDNIEFSSQYDDRKAIIRLFEEKRLSEITQPVAAKAVSVEEENAKQQATSQKFANNLEQHLVNLKSRQAMAITIDKNQAMANHIEKWFSDFEKNLKILFEDP